MDIDEAIMDAEERMINAVAFFDKYLKGVRTGEASTEMVENLSVDIPSYGGITNLKSVAMTTKQDARMLVIKPFDPSTIKDIEKAILKSNLGVTPNNDGKIIRLNFPTMSEENRKKTVKMLKDRLEQQKVSIRTARKESIKHAAANKGKSGISEDAIEAAEKEIQDLTRKHEDLLEAAFAKKSKQVLTV